MSTLTAFILANWIGICLNWVGLLAAQQLVVRRRMQLRPLPPQAPAGGELPVSVILPARNEARDITSCLDRLLAQDYLDLQLVVVDDRSSDDTAARVAAMAAADPRLRLRRVETLPDGWLAKSHALWVGTRGLRSEWLLFIDADCSLAPSAIRTVVAEVRRRGCDGITLWPRNGAVGFWEHMLIPLCGGIIALWFGSRELRWPGRSGFANGQFLLIRREAYERIGGHRSVRKAIIEDIPLAEAAAAAGLSIPSLAGRDLLSVRMYDSLTAIVAGWSRIYVGAIRSGTKLALSVFWLLAGSLLPFIALPILLVRCLSPAPVPAVAGLLVVCLIHLALIVLVSCRFWAMGGCRRRHLLLYPVSVVIVIAILLRAWWSLVVRRRITWRATSYGIDARGCIVCSA